MSTTSARRAYERQAEAAVAKYARLLGLAGEWRFRTRFASADDDSDMQDTAALVESDSIHRIACISFTPCLRPDHYEHEAAHECLHVLFMPLQRAVDALAEPSKTVLDDLLHARIDALARALSGKAPINGSEVQRVPPWETPTATPPLACRRPPR